MRLKNWLAHLYAEAAALNLENITRLVGEKPGARLLDLGCDSGAHTRHWGACLKAESLHGVEIVPARAEQARSQGIEVKAADLNHEIPFPDQSMDVISANQVIEHLYDSDQFLAEIHRVLKPGGWAVISTENASSWCNIFASILGWQIFSLTNFSKRALGIGNPLAMFRGQNLELASWAHVRIYNIRGLKEYFEVFGFKVEEIAGAGYFPLPGRVGRWDVTHSHFITVKARKA